MEKGEIRKMNITIRFKSVITTEETYPQSFVLDFRREIKTTNLDEIFEEAHKFENIITKNLKLVSSTTNIIGITFINDAEKSELMDLARQGICTVESED